MMINSNICFITITVLILYLKYHLIYADNDIRQNKTSNNIIKSQQFTKHHKRKPHPVVKTSNQTQQLSNHDINQYNNTNYDKCRKRSYYFDTNKQIPVYWINLAESIKRRHRCHRQLDTLGFITNHRILAVKPNDPRIEYEMKVLPAIQHTDKELACLSSHLLAIYRAVNDTTSTSNYALIIEDDVIFELDTNFTELALQAPSSFGIIQLMTSSSGAVRTNWNNYKKSYDEKIKKSNKTANPFFKWQQTQGYWSTQAYLINKSNMKKFINQVVTIDNNHTITMKIINPSPSSYPCNKGTNKCHLPFRIVADYYVYLAGEPSYIYQIPIFNGEHVESTIHSKSAKGHSKEFTIINTIINDAINNSYTFPNYIRPFVCLNSNSSLLV